MELLVEGAFQLEKLLLFHSPSTILIITGILCMESVLKILWAQSIPIIMHNQSLSIAIVVFYVEVAILHLQEVELFKKRKYCIWWLTWQPWLSPGKSHKKLSRLNRFPINWRIKPYIGCCPCIIQKTQWQYPYYDPINYPF